MRATPDVSTQPEQAAPSTEDRTVVERPDLSALLDKMDLGTVGAGHPHQSRSMLSRSMSLFLSPIMLILAAWVILCYVYGREIFSVILPMAK